MIQPSRSGSPMPSGRSGGKHEAAPQSDRGRRIHRKRRPDRDDVGQQLAMLARVDTPWPKRRPSVRVWARDTRTSTPHRSGGVHLQFPEEAIEALADAVADRVVERVLNQIESNSTGWLDSAGAAEYLGIGKGAVHKLTSAREIAFVQEVEGGRCFFKRADLDEYREQFRVTKRP